MICVRLRCGLMSNYFERFVCVNTVELLLLFNEKRQAQLTTIRLDSHETDRSFRYASRRLWNQLPASLRQPRPNLSISDSSSLTSGISSIFSVDSPLSSFIAPRSFIPGLKPSFSVNPSHHDLPFLLQD